MTTHFRPLSGPSGAAILRAALWPPRPQPVQVPAITMVLRLRLADRNRVAISQRAAALTVNERIALLRAARRHRSLGLLLPLAVVHLPALAVVILAKRRAIRASARRVMYYDYIPPARRPPEEVWVVRTIASAEVRCRNRDWLFEHYFGGTPEEVQVLLDNDVVGTQSLSVVRRGSITPECALLVLLHRHMCTSTTLVAMAEFFGTDAATLSGFLGVIEEYVDQKWGHLVDIAYAGNFGARFGTYRAAMVRTYAEHIGDDTITALPGRFAGCSAMVDGFRFRICIPNSTVLDDAQRAFYNKKFGGHSVIFIAVSFPDGMVCITGGDPGSMNDPRCVSANNVVQLLDLSTSPTATDSSAWPTPRLDCRPRSDRCSSGT